MSLEVLEELGVAHGGFMNAFFKRSQILLVLSESLLDRFVHEIREGPVGLCGLETKGSMETGFELDGGSFQRLTHGSPPLLS